MDPDTVDAIVALLDCLRESNERSGLIIGAKVGARNDYRAHPLHYAATSADAESVRLLLGAGASVDAQDTFNETPLHWAVAEGRSEPGTRTAIHHCTPRHTRTTRRSWPRSFRTNRRRRPNRRF